MTIADATALKFSGSDTPGAATAQTATTASRTGYSSEDWERVVSAIRTADAAVTEAREAKRMADIAYGEALVRQTAAQRERDQMIVTDPRTSAEVSRHAGITRTRCSQIRSNHGVGPATSTTADSRRLIALARSSESAA